MYPTPSARVSRNRITLITSIAVSLSILLGLLTVSGSLSVQAAPLAAVVNVGAGSYNTTLPVGGGVPSNNAGGAGAPKINAKVNRPIPTHYRVAALGLERLPTKPQRAN